MTAKTLPREALELLMEQDTGVLSTANRDGDISGAVIHYTLGENGRIYVLTSEHTRKVKNILVHDKVSLTAFDRALQRTAQVWGRARIVLDPVHRDQIYQSLIKPRLYGEKYGMPPITKQWNKDQALIELTPIGGVYNDYKRYDKNEY
jgi:general stress protein 26